MLSFVFLLLCLFHINGEYMMGDESQSIDFDYSTQIGAIRLTMHDNSTATCYLIIPKVIICKSFAYFGGGRCLELKKEINSMFRFDMISKGIDLLSGGKLGLVDDYDHYVVDNCAYTYSCRIRITPDHCSATTSKHIGLARNRFVLNSLPKFISTNSLNEYQSKNLLEIIPRMYTSLDWEESLESLYGDCSQCSADLVMCQTNLLNASLNGGSGQNIQNELITHLGNASSLLKTYNESLISCNNDYFKLLNKSKKELTDKENEYQDRMRALHASHSDHVNKLNNEKNSIDANYLSCLSDNSRLKADLKQHKINLASLNQTFTETQREYNKTSKKLKVIEKAATSIGMTCIKGYCEIKKENLIIYEKSKLLKPKSIIPVITEKKEEGTVILPGSEDDSIEINQEYEESEQTKNSKNLLRETKQDILQSRDNLVEFDQLEKRRQTEIDAFSRLLVEYNDEPVVKEKLKDSLSGIYNQTLENYGFLRNEGRYVYRDHSRHRHRGKRSISPKSSFEPGQYLADQESKEMTCIKLDKVSGRLMYKSNCLNKDYESSQNLRKKENRISAINGKSFLSNIMALSIITQQDTYIKPDYKNYKFNCGNCTKLMNAIILNTSTTFEIVTNHIERSGSVFGDNCQNLIHEENYCHNVKVPADSGTEISCSTIIIPSESYSIFKKSLGKFPKRFCRIAGIKLKECSRTHLLWKTISIATIENEFIFIDHMLIHQVIFRRSESSYKSDPENCRVDCYSGSIKCAGDSIFCEEYGCDASSSCKIWYDKFRTGIYLINKDQGFYVQCLHTIRVLVEIEIIDIFVHNNTLEGHNVKTSCEKHGFRIELLRLDLFLEKIHYCLSGKCYTQLSNSKYEVVEIPKLYLVHDQEINIVVYAANFKYGYELNLKCPRQNLCELIKCTFCMERLLNPPCYRLMEYISWVVIIVIMSVIINILIIVIRSSIFMCIVIKVILKLLKELLRYSYIILKIVLFKIYTIIKSRVSRTRNYLEEVNELNIRYENRRVENLDNNRPERNQANAQGRRLIFSREAILGIALILIMNKSVESCNNMNQLAVNTKSCEYDTNGQLKTCIIDSEVVIRLNGLGVSSCVKLDSKSGSKIGMLKAKITNLKNVCVIGDSYYHPQASIIMKSQSFCQMNEWCGQSRCSEIKWDSDMPFKFNNNLNPGKNGCLLTSSWLTGDLCVSPLDRCLYYRHTLVNHYGEYAKVINCVKWSLNVEIELEFLQEDYDKHVSKTFFMTRGSTFEFNDNIKISISGIDKFSEGNVKSTFVIYDKSIYQINANDRNDLKIGNIGEIQCPSSTSATELNSACKFKLDIFKVRDESLYAKDQSSLVNIKEFLSKYNKLPIMIQDRIYDHKDYIPFIDVSNDVQLSLLLSIKDYAVSIAKVETSCSLEFKDLSGCINCDTGAELEVLGQASEDRTLIDLQCKSSSTQFVIMSKPTIHKIRMSFLSLSVDETCYYYCGTGVKKEIKIKGQLHNLNIRYSMNKADSSIVVIKDSANILFPLISNLFSSEHLYFPIILVLVLFFALFFLKKIIRLIYSFVFYTRFRLSTPYVHRRY